MKDGILKTLTSTHCMEISFADGCRHVVRFYGVGRLHAWIFQKNSSIKPIGWRSFNRQPIA
jgi:hypothetical protein